MHFFNFASFLICFDPKAHICIHIIWLYMYGGLSTWSVCRSRFLRGSVVKGVPRKKNVQGCSWWNWVYVGQSPHCHLGGWTFFMQAIMIWTFGHLILLVVWIQVIISPAFSTKSRRDWRIEGKIKRASFYTSWWHPWIFSRISLDRPWPSDIWKLQVKWACAHRE